MKIDGYVKRLLEKNYQNEEDLYNDKKYIIKISNKCKSTQLFKDNIDKFEDFKKTLKEKAKKENISIVWASYLNFLYKIANAPTAIHMRFTPILTIPIIADSLED